MSTRDFITEWRRQLGMSGAGSNSRRHKARFLLAIAAGKSDPAEIAHLITSLGLYATGAKPLADETVAHITNHLSDKPEEAAELRRQLLELVPVGERPQVAEPVPAT